VQPLVFRAACESDLDLLEPHVQRAYRGEHSRGGWTTEADLIDGQRTDRDELASHIASPRSCIVLALSGDALLGSLLLTREPDALYLGMLAVAPARKGGGVGGDLFRHAEQRARELSRTRLRMTVIGQRSELIAWYERRGYRRTGAREPFPYGDPRCGLPRRPDLYFEVLEKRLTIHDE
jgi:ribosomal protein S18 acetylase RimI-like enzyme